VSAGGKRSPIEASRADRAATIRALDAGLNATELRVFLALQHEVTGFDRIEDTVANSRLAALTHVDPRHVRRAVQKLGELGVVERVPGRSRYVMSSYRFPPPDTPQEGQDAPPSGGEPTGAESAPQDLDQGGQVSTPRGAGFDTKGGAYAPASEVPSEASSEGGTRKPVEMMRLLVELDHEKLPLCLRKLHTDHGTDRTTDAIDSLIAESAFFTWPSELKKAIDSRVAGMAEKATVARRLAIVENCPDCHGSGFVLDAQDVALRCSCIQLDDGPNEVY